MDEVIVKQLTPLHDDGVDAVHGQQNLTEPTLHIQIFPHLGRNKMFGTHISSSEWYERDQITLSVV